MQHISCFFLLQKSNKKHGLLRVSVGKGDRDYSFIDEFVDIGVPYLSRPPARRSPTPQVTGTTCVSRAVPWGPSRCAPWPSSSLNLNLCRDCPLLTTISGVRKTHVFRTAEPDGQNDRMGWKAAFHAFKLVGFLC